MKKFSSINSILHNINNTVVFSRNMKLCYRVSTVSTSRLIIRTYYNSFYFISTYHLICVSCRAVDAKTNTKDLLLLISNSSLYFSCKPSRESIYNLTYCTRMNKNQY